MKRLNIAALKKKYPDLHLYYHDNQRWIMYTDESKRKAVAAGDDFDGEGYLPDLVDALCTALDITCESV